MTLPTIDGLHYVGCHCNDPCTCDDIECIHEQCICDRLSTAYRRGREDADKALERLHYPTDLGIWYGLPHLEGVLACNECENLFYEGGGEGERLSLWPCPTITAARGDGEQA